jgi:hypothetical protein
VSAEQEGLSEVRSSTTCWLNPLKLGDLGGENAASAILSRIDALVAAFCQVSVNSAGTSSHDSMFCCIIQCVSLFLRGLFRRFLKIILKVYK